jgi:hypothetical protein
MAAALVVGFAPVALAQGSAPAKEEKPPAAAGGAMDMSKMGPWTRKPTNESKAKKEIEELFKQEEELCAKKDMEGMVARVDFPVMMVTDDAKGAIEAKETSKEQYVAMMKPFVDGAPKDMKTTHKLGISVLSDSLAVVSDDFTTTMGKQKLSGRNSSLLVKTGGQWKRKSMVEAGWGGMPEPPAKK